MRTVFQLFLFTLLPATLFAQKVKWENTTVNFGVVKDWNSPAATFTFQNTGTDRLMFLPQRHDRELLVRYPNRAIRPGESGSITIMFYTGKTGSFSKTVEVFSNASNKADKLTVRGNIKSIYADALTQCPSFQNTTSTKTDEPNVVQAVDEKTNRPIPGTQIEILDRGIRKAVNGTNLDGVAINWVETGKYIAVAYKQGYDKAENEVTFTKRNRSHVIYLKRKSSVEEPFIAIEQQEGEPEVDELIDLGIATNQVLEEQAEEETTVVAQPTFDLGISTNNQWEEPSPVSEAETQPEEEIDLGVSLNTQFTEPELVKEESAQVVLKEAEKPSVSEDEFDMGVSLNEQLEAGPVKEETKEQIAGVENVEEMVEAALAKSEIKPLVNNEAKPVPEPEPEFSKTTFRPNNVLLLLDVSGSMRDGGKMNKLKASINRLVMMLREVDVLTMIAYNSNSWELLPPTPVTDNTYILALVDSLVPFGYTNGVKGMESAYESLQKQLIDGGNNQLIIATDGKFNSSKFSEKDAIQLVKQNRDKGIVLSIIGFGEDKEAARLMRRLADLGEGSFLRVRNNEDPTELLAEEIKLRSRK